MFLANGRLFFGDSATGNLHSIAWANGVPSGSATLADNTADWRARALFRSIGVQPNTAPTAAFAATCALNACDLDGTSSSDPDGTIVSYEWDFGDGGLTGTGAATSHSYAAAGTYTVTLTVTDDRGGADTHQADVTVTGPPNIQPVADIASDCTANVCDFDATGSTDPDGTIAAYLWYFGDGTTGSGDATSHSYTAAGTYAVTLTVTDDDGDTGSTTLTVQVTDAPATEPLPPGAPVATAGVLSALVSWVAPPVVPGAPVTGYTVTSSPGGRTCMTAGATSCTVTGLTAGTSYRFSVTATNRIGTSQASPLSNAVVPAPVVVPPPPPAPPAMVPVVPARLLETRVGADDKTVDGLFQGIGPVRAGVVLELPVAGRDKVPATASAVMLNVTAVFPTGPGYLTVFPCGAPRPLASNVNYAAGQVVPNAVLAKIGTGGTVCIYSLVDTDVVIDVTGFVPAGGSPSTVVPARLLETRVGADDKTVDGLFQGIGPVARRRGVGAPGGRA